MAMVLNRCRQNGELERAEALLNSLPNTQIDRQEQLALLYAAQGRAEEARQLWQSRVLEGISRATTAMQHLANAALKEGRRDDARSIARKVHCLTRAAGGCRSGWASRPWPPSPRRRGRGGVLAAAGASSGARWRGPGGLGQPAVTAGSPPKG